MAHVVKVVFVTRCRMKGMRSNLIVRMTRISVTLTQAVMVNVCKAKEGMKNKGTCWVYKQD